MAPQKRPTTSRPWYSSGSGGMDMKTSSVSRATSASTSAVSHARTKPATIAFSVGEAGAGGDRVGPGAERGAAVEPAETSPGCHHGVLQRVLGVLERAEHPVAVHLQLTAVRLGQRLERVVVPGPRPADQVCFHPRPPLFP